MSSPTNAPAPSASAALERLIVWLSFGLFGVGAFARALPFFEGGSRFLQRFPTEDGYLMLTIARNLAIGNGFSTAAGEIPTNGTQPLTTLIWSFFFALAGGDKELGVALVLLFQLALSGITAWLCYRFLARLLEGREQARSIALLTSAIWFASPIALPHSMNCLETGAYGCMALLVAGIAIDTQAALTWRRAIAFGALLGLAFLVRNDAVFLIAGACLVQGFWPRADPRETLPLRLTRTTVTGLVSIAVASPWLVFNYANFGHIVPVSGRAESLTGTFAGNLAEMPIIWVEYLLAIVPIPIGVQHTAWMPYVAALITLAAVALLLRTWPRLRGAERRLVALLGVFGGGLAVFYGLFFGAGWFLPRYFFPLAPWLMLPMCALLVHLLARCAARPLGYLFALGLFALITGVNARNQIAHAEHPHFEVVRWVQANVPEQAWVGAVQTGTVGFFHDRTMNLDGKVNPGAYEALIQRRLHEYVVASPIEFLADWYPAMRDWMKSPVIASAFEVVRLDPEANVGALRRRVER
jgi:4-amino-4-deoxy-L-arabinose transferase-like glycosyltransferase